MKERHLRSNCLKYSLFLFFFLGINAGFSQEKFTVLDPQGSPLIGVSVYNLSRTFTGVTGLVGDIHIHNVQQDEKLIFEYLSFKNDTTSLARLRRSGDKLVMIPDIQVIEEVVVIGRSDISREALPYQVQSIDSKKISSTQSQTSADILANHGQLFVQKSQLGGGSPVIRGFEANKVLLVVDGVRMNNIIYRNGHLQNAITVDPFILDKMEVIFGPNSVLYGSDAFGGVVHFKSRTPILNFTKKRKAPRVNLVSRYSTASQEKTFHLDVELSGKNIASLSSISYNDFGNLRMGADRDVRFPNFGKRLIYAHTINNGIDQIRVNPNPNIQLGTGYQQLDINQKLVFRLKSNLHLIANMQLSTSSDIPRYDQLIEPSGAGLRWADWHYGPQRRSLFSLTARYFTNHRFFDRAVVIGSYQHLHEDRISRRFGSSAEENQLERVSIYCITADFEKKWGNHQVNYGVETNINSLESTAFERNIVTNSINPNINTRYPDGDNHMTTLGIFGQYHWQMSSHDNITTGLRWSRQATSFSYQGTEPIRWPRDFYTGIKNENNALTWSLGWTHQTSNDWKWRLLTSTAFRAPNIDDIAKIRINGQEITFPNINLSPEKSINAEISLSKTIDHWQWGKMTLSTTGYYTRLSDAIVRRNFMTPSGRDTYVNHNDTMQVVANINAQNAYIYGWSANLHWAMDETFTIQSDVNLTKGRVINESTNNTPLDHIPPMYGKLVANYTPNQKWNIQLAYRWNAAKPLSEYGGSADNPELATEIGTLAYQTTNVYSTIKLLQNLECTLGIENIFDKHYRPFASGVSGAGINGIFTLKAHW